MDIGEENEKLCNFLISFHMVLDKLKKLKTNKSPGVDLIGSWMLIESWWLLIDPVTVKIANWLLIRQPEQ